MKISNQTSSHELSQRLCELGVKKKSIFWYKPGGKYPTLLLEGERSTTGYYRAYTVAELGRILPERIIIDGRAKVLRTFKTLSTWYVKYEDYETDDTEFWEKGKEANARARMVIYLVENNLLTFKPVWKQLKNSKN